ncbi:TPA: hypothetical protein J4S02_003964 [Escherichia coli]|nr:hypothetical protein [Escherichia coli]
MQVGLTSSSLATGGAHSAAVSSSTVAPTQAVRQKLPATASEYPASPLITTRPQRYSVQLNDQLTTLQQADHYLGQLEQQLLDYRHSQRKSGQAQGTALTQMLDKRTALSGGAVDRQLQPVLQGEARVSAMADQMLLDAKNPQSAGNRRIEIMVLTKSASDTLYQYFGQHGDKVVQPLVKKLDKQQVLSQRTR